MAMGFDNTLCTGYSRLFCCFFFFFLFCFVFVLFIVFFLSSFFFFFFLLLFFCDFFFFFCILCYFIFPKKTGFDFHANCLLRTICMKCQNLFSGNKKKNLIFFLACLTFNNLCQEKMAHASYVGNECPDHFAFSFYSYICKVPLVMS